MFVFSLVEFSKGVQNEISAKVMPEPQNCLTQDSAERNAKQTQLLYLA
jgi:hypothetical protein